LNKKTIKTVAAATVFAFGVSVIPAPAYAVPTNIVAATEGKNTLTLTEIQELAVIYNDTVDSLELSIKQLENQETMVESQRDDARDSLNSIDFSSGTEDDSFSTMIKDLETERDKAEDEEEKTRIQNRIDALKDAQNSANAASNAAADMMFDQTLSQIQQLDDALEQLAEGKEDLQDAIEDLAHIMRYTSSQLALSIVQLTDSAELMEKQVELLDKSIAIYELQEKLGMATTINVDTQRTSKVEAENQLRDTMEQIDNLKRSLNQLIGRPANNELNVVPMKLAGVIDPAPKFTQELIDEFVEIDPDVVALLEERQDLKDSVKSGMGSDEKQDIEYQIQAKDLELKKQRQAAEDDLKAMIATMNKNAVNYRVSMEKLATEQKNFEIAQKKYELGMISQLQLMQNEMALAQAELTNLSNGYQHYFDWQQFKLARQGIALTGASK